MNKKSRDHDAGYYEPGNPLEKMAERIEERLRASGMEVKIMEGVDSDEYVVTFPSNPKAYPKPKKKTSSKKEYRITVDYGYDIHSVTVSQSVLDQINRGEAISIQGQGFSIAGTMSKDVWNFHCAGLHSLEVDGENGHQIYIGKISSAFISENKK